LETNQDLSPELAEALVNGTAIGGARPKVLIEDGGEQYIAKFETSSDVFSVVGAEQASIYLAQKVGIEVTDSRLVRSLGKDVLLIRRFDRPGDGTRRMVVSALTMLGLDENTFDQGSYPMILDVLRAQSAHPGRWAVTCSSGSRSTSPSRTQTITCGTMPRSGMDSTPR
jgi:serine/threonine-protein kinase HipA